MGNSSSDQNHSSLLAEIGHAYQEVRREERGIVLFDKENQHNCLLKEYTFSNEITFQNKLDTLKRQIEHGPRQYVISPLKVEPKIFKNFCSTSYKVYAIFEFPQVTLKEEILARQSENKNFEQAQLWSILQSCSNALGQLKPCLSLNPTEIFIDADGHLKVIHDDLIEENYRAILTKYIYYAPEKMGNFNRLDTELSMRKEAIFSMGMTLLETALLEEASQCYDYNQQTFNEAMLEEKIDKLSEKYSIQFVEVLSNVLEINPNRRASLMEVQKGLDNYWASEEHEKQEDEEQNIQTLQASPQEKVLTQKKNMNSIKQLSQNSSTKKEKQLVLPGEVGEYKVQPPLETPKNPPADKQNIYTDPKLLEMIRKDLEDINKLKQSGFYETGRYSYMYPKTQSILNSIRNMDKNQEFQPIPPEFKELSTQQHCKQTEEEAPNKIHMKKNNNNLIYTIETYEDGRRYEGMTLHGKKHGQGKLIFEDGAFYEGEFREDKMNGMGILYYGPDHPAYDGEWKNDQFHGVGTLYNEHPEEFQGMYGFEDFNEVQDYWVKYEGDFVYDNKSGKGRLVLTNGEVLDGQFQDDFVNGQCTFRRPNGERVNGVWEMSVLSQVFEQ